MKIFTIIALKSIIALALAGSLVVLGLILPAAWRDLQHGNTPLWQQIAFISIPTASVITMQVFGVCVWRLLTLVRKGSVFSKAAFGYVNVLIGTFVVAALLAFTPAGILAPGEMAPGVVGLIGGAGLILSGFALLVGVMRQLLTQAIEYQSEARTLRSELDEVI